MRVLLCCPGYWRMPFDCLYFVVNWQLWVLTLFKTGLFLHAYLIYSAICKQCVGYHNCMRFPGRIHALCAFCIRASYCYPRALDLRVNALMSLVFPSEQASILCVGICVLSIRKGAGSLHAWA
jgi:hypothetical protein